MAKAITTINVDGSFLLKLLITTPFWLAIIKMVSISYDGRITLLFPFLIILFPAALAVLSPARLNTPGRVSQDTQGVR